MKFMGIFLTLFGIIMIAYPEFLAYLIGGFFLFVGFNIILFNLSIISMKKGTNFDERGSFFKFGKYKIYK